MSLGPHEQQLRALREKKAAQRARRSTTPPAAPAPPKESPMFDTDNAGAVPEPERRPRKPAKKKIAKKAKKKPAKKAKSAKKKIQKVSLGGVVKMGLRSGTKLVLIGDMLRRPGGCTRAEVMAACKWPSVSMQQQATALGRELVTTKEAGAPTRYSLKPL